MLDRFAIVPIVLVVQALAAYSLSHGERVPATPSASTFPRTFGTWDKAYEDPQEPGTREQLGADLLVSNAYNDPAKHANSSLLVAWFSSQTDGVRQPHSPKVCLPGSGWIPELSDEVQLNTGSGMATINRYVVAYGASRAVVLYWFQTPRRAVASEWSAKFWTVADAIRDHRTDTALVRLVSFLPPGGNVDEATKTTLAFGEAVYPRLREYLPK